MPEGRQHRVQDPLLIVARVCGYSHLAFIHAPGGLRLFSTHLRRYFDFRSIGTFCAGNASAYVSSRPQFMFTSALHLMFLPFTSRVVRSDITLSLSFLLLILHPPGCLSRIRFQPGRLAMVVNIHGTPLQYILLIEVLPIPP